MAEKQSILPLYDAHAHLQDSRLAASVSKILADLRTAGVRRVVVNGTREVDWPRVLEFAQASEMVIPSLGLHPWYVKDRSEDWFASLSTALRARKCAVGEIGLDRWMEGYDSACQEQVFVDQLALAHSLQRPVSIHCLKAWGRLLEILSSEQLPANGILLHSYGGPAEMVEQFADLGVYFSFSGYFAYARKAKQRDVFRSVPRDRLLIETDAPDMAPPDELREFKLKNGNDHLNHPANLRMIYAFAADLLGINLEEFTALVEKNFRRLFAGVF